MACFEHVSAVECSSFELYFVWGRMFAFRFALCVRVRERVCVCVCLCVRLFVCLFELERARAFCVEVLWGTGRI